MNILGTIHAEFLIELLLRSQAPVSEAAATFRRGFDSLALNRTACIDHLFDVFWSAILIRLRFSIRSSPRLSDTVPIFIGNRRGTVRKTTPRSFTPREDPARRMPDRKINVSVISGLVCRENTTQRSRRSTRQQGHPHHHPGPTRGAIQELRNATHRAGARPNT